jgi:cysteinyl-tRNA synthetase
MVFAAHYRMKMDFSWEGLDIFVVHLASLKQTLRRIKEISLPAGRQGATSDGGQADAAVMAEFMAALADDVNTPQAWAVFLAYLKDTNANLNSKEEAQTRLATLLAMDKVIGVAEVLWDELMHEEVPTAVMELVAKRDALKAAKKYEESDSVRVEIEMAGYKLEDTAHGTRVIKIG